MDQILLHACCGPCLEWPARLLLSENIEPVVWYYNPNIHPPVENQRRRDNLLIVTRNLNLTCMTDDICEPEIWLNWQESKALRCQMCYYRRLESAAQKALELGLRAFSTTLLVSPYQDHETIRTIGEQLEQNYGVAFVYRDFRPGYREGQALARADGLYRQKYCGCLPSIEQSRFKDQIRQDLEDLLGTQAKSDNDHK